MIVSLRTVGMMLVLMFMGMPMRMGVSVFVALVFMLIVIVLVSVVMVVTEMNIKFNSTDLRLLCASDVQVISFEVQFFQLSLQAVGVNAEVDERADEHIAADAAEDVEIQGFHLLERLSQSMYPISSM